MVHKPQLAEGLFLFLPRFLQREDRNEKFFAGGPVFCNLHEKKFTGGAHSGKQMKDFPALVGVFFGCGFKGGFLDKLNAASKKFHSAHLVPMVFLKRVAPE